MQIVILASGSKGNATYIKTDHTTLLIDAGISYRQIRLRLLDRGLSLDHLDAVLVTHEHSDHVKGLQTLIKYTGAKVFTKEDTFNHLYARPSMELPYTCFHRVDHLEPFILNDLKITPIDISHDAVSAVGYIIETEGKKLVYMTDVGYLPETDYTQIKNADMYVFEANYDVSLLFSSARPYYLKKRIDSVKGHLSNADSAYHLTKLIGDKTKTIVLAHPSAECNTKTHVLDTFTDIFTSYNLAMDAYEIIVAEQHIPTKLIQL